MCMQREERQGKERWDKGGEEGRAVPVSRARARVRVCVGGEGHAEGDFLADDGAVWGDDDDDGGGESGCAGEEGGEEKESGCR